MYGRDFKREERAVTFGWRSGLKRNGREDDHGRGVRARERKIVNMVKFSARNEQGTRDKEKVA